MTSRKYYEMELQKLNASLLEMGEMIRMAIGGAVTALLEFDHDKAREIIAYDEQIDRQNREIEQQCYTLLLSQQPVAGDLRMVSAALKMTTDMERIGDHAADISEIELMLENLPTLSCAPIRQMATETSVMLIKSLEAFAQRDEEKANWVIGRDDVVDDLFDTVKSELIEAIRQNADNGEAATDLLMAAKYFERIGDHATNIAQWAIFSITGEMPKD
ncbi:MAG: phosphate signaling complex protein PhoU [Christensenellales bacterium]|nr:phosphate signaling complex protein PhoU [Christensenellales bacterium]